MNERTPSINDLVIWHDATGTPHNALITAVWGPICINVVFVSSDESRQDNFGRQIERQTSCMHKSSQLAHGFYWRFPDEEPNPYTAPIAV